MMADRRHLEDPMPLIFVLDKFCIVVSPNDAFLRVVARSFGEEGDQLHHALVSLVLVDIF